MGNLFSWISSLCTGGRNIENEVYIAPVTDCTKDNHQRNTTGKHMDMKYSNIQVRDANSAFNFKGNK